MDEVLPSSEVLALLRSEFGLHALDPSVAGETAERWAYDDGRGEIGLISSVTQAFCGDCNRARLSTEGKLYTCLFAHQGHDLRSLLRPDDGRPISDTQIGAALAGIWGRRDDRYSQLRSAETAGTDASLSTPRRVEMHYIGG
jgi:cyclic pyranopterin phosphate synthase